MELQLKRIDEGGIDGDLCAIINANGKQAVAVVWPTAEKLKTLKQLAEVGAAICVQVLSKPMAWCRSWLWWAELCRLGLCGAL